MGLTVVAEGVETEEQRRLLEAHGCDAVQGYLLSRPLDGDACRHFLHGEPSRLHPRPVSEGVAPVPLRRVK
jgi:EAL domain-containing protein (putative c-di-GMP-specific phosphodiesterase class I)